MPSEQLELPLTSSHQPPQNFVVSLYRNGDLLGRTQPSSHSESNAKRRSLVSLIQRSPYCFITWEEDPRATGWFGVRVDPPANASAVFHATVERT